MKHLHFDVETAGFYGAYWACAGGSDCAVIAMIGDDPEDRLARSAAKWLCGRGVNVLTMSPAKKDYGHHNYPLERIEAAISWLKANGNQKIGIAGASTTGTLALTAAAMFPDITLTIAMTPSDFVWQGFMQGKRDGCKEWPVEGESLFSYRGKPLPYMPFCYQHPDYWHCIAAESKRTGDMVNSRKLFDDSEAAHPIRPEEFIPIENIRGKLLLIGAEDDVLWDTAKYIRRMEKRFAEKPHACEVETAVYAHGTHFVFPEGMLKTMLPVRSGLTGTTTNFKDRQVLHWQHLPVPLRTFRDVHIPNHANIRVMDFHRLAGVFGPLHILLMHHDFLNKQPQQLRRQLLNVCVAFGPGNEVVCAGHRGLQFGDLPLLLRDGSFQLLLLRHITGGEGLELLRGDAAQYAVLIQSLEDGLQFRLALFHP